MAKVTLASLMASAVMMSGAAAVAQDAEASVSVKNRPNSDYDAKGVPAGGFTFFPALDVSGAWNDNIYATKAGKEDDFITTVKPSVRLASNWNQNSLAVYADADFGYYSDATGEDYKDYTIGVDGRADIDSGSYFSGGLNYGDKHEDRGAPDSAANAAEPTSYSVFNADVAYKRDVSVFSLGLDSSFVKTSYDDTALNGGGFTSQGHRDRERYTYGARVGYEIGEGTEAYVRATGNVVNYDNSKLNGGPQRNSDGYEAVVGAKLDLSGKTAFDGYVGMVKQDYDGGSLKPIKEMTYGMSLLWNPSQMTSIISNVSRSVLETAVFEVNGSDVFVAASGLLNTSYTFRVEHELRRNIMLEAGVGYSTMDFKGTVRSDEIVSADIGVEYLLNRNVRLAASHKIEDKSTNVGRGEFKRNVTMLNLKAQF